MLLFVGLGNPGKEYEKTRHNAGFMAIDKLAEMLNIEMKKNKFDAIIGEGNLGNQKIILAKPQTYMNLSGVSVSQIMDFYKLDIENLIVIYDDIDIDFGKIRIRKSGSAGTHNGMRNIIQMLANSDFPRIRIGTGKPQNNMDLADYVLSKLSKEEMVIFENVISEVCKAACKIVDSDIQSAMNDYNGI